MLSLHLSWAIIPPAAPLGGSGSASLLRGIPGRTDRKALSAGGLPPRIQIRPLSFRRKRGLGQPGTPAPPGDSLPPGGFTGVLGTRCPPRCSGARESEYETRKVRPKLPTCGQPVKPFSSRALRGFSQYEIPLAGPWPAPPSTAISTPTPDRVPRAPGRRSPPGSAGMGSLPGRRGALSATSAAAPILGRCSGAEEGDHRGPGRLANPSERPEATRRRWQGRPPYCDSNEL